MADFEINIPASAVKLTQKGDNMAFTIGLNLTIGGNVTVSGGGAIPAALSAADFWFDAREGVASGGDGTAVTSWTDRNNSIAASPASVGPTFRDASLHLSGQGPVLDWGNLSDSVVGLEFADVSVSFVMAVAIYVQGTDPTFAGFNRLFGGPSKSQVGAGKNNRWRTISEDANQFSETSVKNGGSEAGAVLPSGLCILEFTAASGATNIDTIGNFSGAATGRGWRGDIYQIAGWTTKPSASEITEAREYLANLYGITL